MVCSGFLCFLCRNAAFLLSAFSRHFENVVHSMILSLFAAPACTNSTTETAGFLLLMSASGNSSPFYMEISCSLFSWCRFADFPAFFVLRFIVLVASVFLPFQSLDFNRDFGFHLLLPSFSFESIVYVCFLLHFPALLRGNLFVKANDYCDCYFQRLMEMFSIYFGHFSGRSPGVRAGVLSLCFGVFFYINLFFFVFFYLYIRMCICMCTE